MKLPISVGMSLLAGLALLPVTQGAAASPELTESVLACRSGMRAVAGTVVDAATLQPLPGAVVMVPVANGLVLTDEQGRFTIGLEGQADRVAVRIQFPGYVTSTKTIALGEQQAAIQLKKLGGSFDLANNSRSASPSAWAPANGASPSTGGFVPRDPTPFATADICAELF